MDGLIGAEQGDVPKSTKVYLYASHGLSAWGIRGFEFLVGLVLIRLYDSLFMVSLFGMFDSLTVALLTPYTASFVDSMERYQAATSMYFVQNLGTFISSAGFLVLLFANTMKTGFMGVSVVGISIVAACISSLGAMGSTISVEREWTKALCGQGDNDGQLSQINSVMKRIDLVCLIGSPICVGVLLETQGYLVSVGALCLYTVLSWPVECYTLKLAISSSVRLQQVRVLEDIKDRETKQESALSLWGLGRFQMYVNQKGFLFALSLALVYMTVMSFGSLMTGFLAWKGLGEGVLSIFRGLGAIGGVFATVIFPKVSQEYGLEKSALFSISGQVAVLIIALIPMIVCRNACGVTHVSEIILLTMLSISRFFLWLFDLSVNQIIQETVPKDAVGSVFGVQNGLQSGFQTLAYAVTLLWSDPRQFLWLMILSDTVIVFATILTFVGYYRMREYI